MLAGLAGCGGGKEVTDPVAELRRPALSSTQRAAYVEEAWARAEADPSQKPAVRKALRDVVWQQDLGEDARVAALRTLIADDDPTGEAELKEMLRLMLPREPNRTIVSLACQHAEQRGWRDFAPALVRSWSREVEGVEDVDRSERIALARLYPDGPVEDAVFAVFLNPPESAERTGLNWADRTRADAWDLLARLDPLGTRRQTLLAGVNLGPVSESSARVVEHLRASVRDLKAVPLTGAELRWAASLRDPKKSENAAWWSDASSAAATLRPGWNEGMGLRHVEPVRWAARNEPALLTMTREELIAALRSRLEGRERFRRTADTTEFKLPVKETIDAWESKLRAADVVAMLVVDRALRDPEVVKALFVQAQADRRDQTTEFGGVLSARSQGGFLATMYPPRPSQRTGDTAFVASEEMIAASDRALAHYHFHVQRERNEGYAGPSDGDLKYAAKQGRNCVVLTSVREGTLAIDFYQPDGVVIDLGTIESGAR